MTAKTERRRRKKFRRGKPNTLPEPLPDVDGAQWGPKMKALPSDRHRAFVLALYEIPRGHGAQVKAAHRAGFGTSTSSPQSMAAIASMLAHDERILEAMREEDERRIRASAPRAIRALAHLIETPDHKDHGRAIGMVMDRVHPLESVHRVEVEHKGRVIVATEEVLARIAQLATKAGLEPASLPPLIEGTCTEITDEEE
jgi:hypothetical protein